MISILIFPSALFLYISTFLLLPYHFYYGQPFGTSRSSLHSRLSDIERIGRRYL
jgi:hypothetical protein